MTEDEYSKLHVAELQDAEASGDQHLSPPRSCLSSPLLHPYIHLPCVPLATRSTDHSIPHTESNVHHGISTYEYLRNEPRRALLIGCRANPNHDN